MTKEQVLKKYFGYDAFRPLQADIIDHVLAGQDALVLMPTGGGKSICYQVPALMGEGLTIVISPLIALMKDQVEALRGNGVKAAYLNSSLTSQEQDAILWAAKMGEIKLLYIAPERLFSGYTLDFFKNLTVSLIAVDESHCISSWGHDFRPEYRQLSYLKAAFPTTPVIALTATADKITRRDICRQLNIPESHTFISSFDRPNISLSVYSGRKRLEQIKGFLTRHRNQPGIIYCLSRKNTETLTASLQAAGFDAECYHAGLPAEQRNKVQERFLRDDTLIMVATVAFGMGIDKSNVRWIMHYSLPSNVESFYQEIGRAGRDGQPAQAILFYTLSDVFTRREMIQNSELPEEQKELAEAKLTRLQQYAEANICRRRILISYFNEEVTQDCGNCDVCRNPRPLFDATILAQKALSAVARTREQVGLNTVVDILRGSRNQQVIRMQYHELPTFGIGREYKPEMWLDYLIQLVNYGALEIAYDENHVAKLNEVSWQILKGQRIVSLAKYVSPNERKAKLEEDTMQAPRLSKQDMVKNELFGLLKQFRKHLADTLRLPPYLIFSDGTLLAMANQMPTTKAEMLDVSGVGQEKYQRYGEAFLKEIDAYLKDNPDAKSMSLQQAAASRSARKLDRKLGKTEPKISTFQQTLQLFKEGMSVEEIAEQRVLSPTTVVGHLIKLKEEGEAINLRTLIDQPTLIRILALRDELNWQPTEPMKPIFEALDGAVGYDKIRVALAIGEV